MKRALRNNAGLCRYAEPMRTASSKCAGAAPACYSSAVPGRARRTLPARSWRGQRSETEALALLTAADLLVLDEVGFAIGNGATRRAMLFDVLNDRYGEMRPTILIGNLTAAELEGYLGERIMERLMDLGSIMVPFTWPSHRRRG